MATKKQQRRREKLQRHEYVYVDEEGNEVEPPAVTKPADSSAKASSKPAASSRGRKAPKPPTWTRALKWAGTYTAFMLVFSVATTKKGSALPSVLFALVVGILIIPAFYWMHRFQYRAWVKLEERQKPKPRSAR